MAYVVEGRRRCGYVVPVPRARKRRERGTADAQANLALDGSIDAKSQEYGVAKIVDEIRQHLRVPASQLAPMPAVCRLGIIIEKVRLPKGVAWVWRLP